MNKFKNLKIRFFLKTPVILDRLTTIDSILIAQYFADLENSNRLKEFTMPTPDNITFIDSRNGVFSGSIWYIDDSEIPAFNKSTIIKHIDIASYVKYTAGTENISIGSGPYKAYKIDLQSMLVKSVYFYIRGDVDTINDLCSRITNIGKKRHIGYGIVDRYTITLMSENKGFMLAKSNPSKPLPVELFPEASTGKIALYRPRPPYYIKQGKVPCYMPTMSYYEKISHFKALKSPVLKNISSSELACEAGSIKPANLPKNPHHCSLCGSYSDYTVHISVLKKQTNFNDYPDIKPDSDGNMFICRFCLPTLSASAINALSGRYISKNEIIPLAGESKIKQYTMLQGKAQSGQWLKDKFVRKMANQEIDAPYIITIKPTKNSEHLVWKTTAGISTGIIPIQYGNSEATHGKTIYIDTELLKEAIDEVDSGTAPPLYNRNIAIRNKLEPEQRRFFAKYGNDVVRMLSFVKAQPPAKKAS